MTYCVKCGAQVEDGIGICPQCGAVIPGAFDTDSRQYTSAGQRDYESQSYEDAGAYNGGQSYGGENAYNGGQSYEGANTYSSQFNGDADAYNSQQYTYEQSADYEYDPDYFPQSEVKQNKVMAVLAYLGILVLIPVLAGDKSSDYLKQHINQGLVLFVIDAVLEVIEKIVDHVILVGGALSWAVDVANFAFFIIAIMGIVSAAKGTRKLLPTIGNIRIFK